MKIPRAKEEDPGHTGGWLLLTGTHVRAREATSRTDRPITEPVGRMVCGQWVHETSDSRLIRTS